MRNIVTKISITQTNFSAGIRLGGDTSNTNFGLDITPYESLDIYLHNCSTIPVGLILRSSDYSNVDASLLIMNMSAQPGASALYSLQKHHLQRVHGIISATATINPDLVSVYLCAIEHRS